MIDLSKECVIGHLSFVYRKGALGMNNLVQKVSEYMQEQHMAEDGQKIVVGVSGGADSMGLLTVLTELAEYFHYSRVVVHVNHGIRPMWKLSAGNGTFRAIVFMWT